MADEPAGYRFRYKEGSDGQFRPILFLSLISPGGGGFPPIPGIIDSGADYSALPEGYATLLGYDAGQLDRQQIFQASGSATVWRAKEPCIASLPGRPEINFPVRPLFVPGALNALWGRGDFMRAFKVLVNEPDRIFVLIPNPPDAEQDRN